MSLLPTTDGGLCGWHDDRHASRGQGAVDVPSVVGRVRHEVRDLTFDLFEKIGHDRRVVRARVLPKGRRLLLTARDRRVALLTQRLETLDAEDLNTVGKAATILSALANKPGRHKLNID